MQLLKDLVNEAKKKNKRLKTISEEILKEKGYVYNEVVGWEKLEILKKFNLDQDMKTTPGELYDELETRERKTAETDSFGNKTGEYKIEYTKIKTGKKYIGPTKNFQEYMEYRDIKSKQGLAQGDYMNNLINTEKAFK